MPMLGRKRRRVPGAFWLACLACSMLRNGYLKLSTDLYTHAHTYGPCLYTGAHTHITVWGCHDVYSAKSVNHIAQCSRNSLFCGNHFWTASAQKASGTGAGSYGRQGSTSDSCFRAFIHNVKNVHKLRTLLVRACLLWLMWDFQGSFESLEDMEPPCEILTQQGWDRSGH